MVLFLISILVLVITGCSEVTSEKYGFWVDEKPYRGSLEKNKFHVRPYWQCVESNEPYKNKRCEKK